MGIKQTLKKWLFPTRPRLKQMNKRVEDLEVQLRQWMSLAELKYDFSLPPVPPKSLQVRVAGAYYATFFEHGRDMFRELETILGKHGLSFSGFHNVLDFGCGCGRLLIPMSLLADAGKLSGTDIDAEAIAWMKSRYSCFKDLDVNPHAPPTKYADGEFDFVYSISIFTHLPEEMQRAWLKELSRILKPGGHGIFTTHGENHFVHLPAAGRAKLVASGFHYSDLGATEGLPDFYRASFQTREYIAREWAQHFEVVAVYEKGMCQNQDAVLVRKRAG
jgi:SAM-dependent methyltransferase